MSKFFQGQITLYPTLDVESVRADGNDGAIKTFVFAAAPEILQCDVAIAGGGMGGIAAALSCGTSMILTEENSWLGGQLSSQGVAALDENKYVETTGACANYLELRKNIRDAYRRRGSLTELASADPLLHPGTSWVTRLAFEPQVAVAVIDRMLAPLIDSGRLRLLKRTKIVAVHLVSETDSRIDALLAVNLDSGKFVEIECAVAIDATELGDLMPMARIPYQTGSDSRWLTAEAHAPETGNADNVQDFTYPFVVTFHPGENHTIEKPADYDSFNQEGKFSFDGYKMFVETDDEKDGKKRHLLPFWTYRRLIDKALFKEGTYQSDVSMINWDSNDLRGKNIIDKDADTQLQYLALAKRLSLGFLYWLQTEAPRDDGGMGYPELKLVTNVLGTSDGLSQYPYIREARRLAATTVVVEEDIVEGSNEGARARLFEDSCGIGLYPVDIHGYQEVPGAAQQTKPFQVPTGALLTEYCPNYIAACKNIGVTHITNGAYRLHPIEWAVGTAAGAIARLALQAQKSPLHFVQPFDQLLALQIDLAMQGAPLFWFDDLPPEHDCFAAAQVLAATGLLQVEGDSLSFHPEKSITESDVTDLIERANQRFGHLADWEAEVRAMTKQEPEQSRSQFARALFKLLQKTGTGYI
ncbi:MAG: FAD-dependent oxidoreductase [Cyanobacteria bacterium SZAS LIN-2]|nr:FAD-dependent oxidoreductase [Cyanobacteria bacterium SZAS LIN-2]